MSDTPRCDSLHTLEVMQWKPLAEDLERELAASRKYAEELERALEWISNADMASNYDMRKMAESALAKNPSTNPSCGSRGGLDASGEVSGEGVKGPHLSHQVFRDKELLQIDRDNLRGSLDWIREKVSPYLIGRDFDPRGRATENLIATLLERYDVQYKRLKYLASVAPPLCPSCGCIKEHQPCNADGAITGCFDKFHAICKTTVDDPLADVRWICAHCRTVNAKAATECCACHKTHSPSKSTEVKP